MFASIPSPPINKISIGPLDIHFYGVLIGLGVLVAIYITARRYQRFGGDPGLAERVAVWAVVGGLIGARLAYVLPRWTTVTADGIWHVFAIWEGGLSIFGGLTLGAITALVLMVKERGDFVAFADAAAVGIPAAQAIGRWGNYMNQELFGTPSNLPWAVEIDPIHRPPQYADASTFHPTFLYESLWNALVVIPLLLWLQRRFKLARGNMFVAYLVLYSIGRFSLEFVRTDQATHVFGFRANQLVSGILIVVGIAFFAWRQRQLATSEAVAAAAVAAPGSSGFHDDTEHATTSETAEIAASDEATDSSDGPSSAG